MQPLERRSFEGQSVLRETLNSPLRLRILRRALAPWTVSPLRGIKPSLACGTRRIAHQFWGAFGVVLPEESPCGQGDRGGRTAKTDFSNSLSLYGLRVGKLFDRSDEISYSRVYRIYGKGRIGPTTSISRQDAVGRAKYSPAYTSSHLTFAQIEGADDAKGEW